MKTPTQILVKEVYKLIKEYNEKVSNDEKLLITSEDQLYRILRQHIKRRFGE